MKVILPVMKVSEYNTWPFMREQIIVTNSLKKKY